MGYKKENVLCNYLGIELEKGNKHNKEWNLIQRKIDARIGGWKEKGLTKSRKITMIRAVLLALVIYPLSCLPRPKFINKELEEKFRNFLWNDSKDSKD